RKVWLERDEHGAVQRIKVEAHVLAETEIIRAIESLREAGLCPAKVLAAESQIIYEGPSGRPLSDLLQAQELAVGESLQVATGLGRALHTLENHGLTHGFLNPYTVVVVGEGIKV